MGRRFSCTSAEGLGSGGRPLPEERRLPMRHAFRPPPSTTALEMRKRAPSFASSVSQNEAVINVDGYRDYGIRWPTCSIPGATLCRNKTACLLRFALALSVRSKQIRPSGESELNDREVIP